MIKHIKNSIQWFLLFLGLFFVAEDMYNRLSPQTWWFEYYPPKVEIVNKDNGLINFHTNAEIKQTTFIRWEDTLRCVEPDGRYKKYDTQVWEQQKLPREKEEPTLDWEYNYFPEQTGNRNCQLCGTITAKSRSTVFNDDGYDKIDSYCTETFIY